MPYSFYVTDHFGNRVPVNIRPASREDYQQTKTDQWQTNWNSPYIRQRKLKKFAMLTCEEKELVGLLAIEPLPENYCLHMAYMEASPTSNPTLAKHSERKYYGIGKAMFAFAIEQSILSGFDGTLVFKAKTTELYYHYIGEYHAMPLGHTGYELILFPDAGLPILESYEEEEE